MKWNAMAIMHECGNKMALHELNELGNHDSRRSRRSRRNGIIKDCITVHEGQEQWQFMHEVAWSVKM